MNHELEKPTNEDWAALNDYGTHRREATAILDENDEPIIEGMDVCDNPYCRNFFEPVILESSPFGQPMRQPFCSDCRKELCK